MLKRRLSWPPTGNGRIELKRIIVVTLLILSLFCQVAQAANTVVRDGNLITLTLDGSTNWDSQTDYPNGLAIHSIAFYPSAANDVLAIRHRSVSGPMVLYCKDTAGAGVVRYYPGALLKPYIVASELTLNTAANARVIIVLK